MSRAASACSWCLAVGFTVIHKRSIAAAASDASGAPVIGLLQVLFALLIVLATIWGFAWFMRRFLPAQSSSAAMLKIVGGVMVGPRERLVVVEVGETWLLLGVGAGRVALVHSMPRPVDAGSVAAGDRTQRGFSRALQRALRSGSGR